MSLKKFHNLAKNKLFTICRSITGNGVRETLKEIKKKFPKLKVLEIPSGSKAFDWTVPPEWNIAKAFVVDKNGKKIIDFKKNNLHLIGYSKPINQYISKKTLLNHIYSLPKQPLAIPYITSYYKRFWGFCISHKEKILIEKKYKESDKFKVLIDSSFNNKGSLTYGEFIIKGNLDLDTSKSYNIEIIGATMLEEYGYYSGEGLFGYDDSKNRNENIKVTLKPIN